MADKGHQNTPEKRTNYPTSQQAEGPPARALNRHPTHLNRPTAAAGPQPANLASEERHHKLCQHVKAKTPLTRGYAVPKVGLELHSNPCKLWELPET